MSVYDTSKHFYPNQASLGIHTIPENLQSLIVRLRSIYSIDLDTLTIALDYSFAVAGQASFDVQRPSDKRPIPVGDFFVIAAPSGSRKDTVIGTLSKPIMDTQENWIERHNKANVTQPKPIILVNSATTEGIRNHLSKGLPYLGLVTGEICTFLGGYSMKPEQKAATLGSMSRWWDGCADTTITAMTGVMHTRNHPRFSAAIWGQPELVTDFMFDQKAIYQGLLNRFLPHIAGEFEPSPLVSAQIDSEEDYLRYCEQIKSLMSHFDPANYAEDIAQCRRLISLDEEAQSLWSAFYTQCQTAAYNDPDFQSYWVRLSEHCLRASARQCFMRLPNGIPSGEQAVINFEDVHRAIQRSLAHAHTARLFIITGSYQTIEADAKQLQEWLTKQEPKRQMRFPESFVGQRFPKRRLRNDRNARKRALEHLCDDGILNANNENGTIYYSMTAKTA